MSKENTQSSIFPSFGLNSPSAQQTSSQTAEQSSMFPSFGLTSTSANQETSEPATQSDTQPATQSSMFPSFGLTSTSANQTTSQPATQSSLLPNIGLLSSSPEEEEDEEEEDQIPEQKTSQPSYLQRAMVTASSGVQKIDISMKNIAGNCDSKCAYSFRYAESSSTAKNNRTMITLTYDSAKVPPVTFNGQKYNVGNIMITCPSIHRFNGKLLSGEIIITHIPVKGGNSLDVCVPFKLSREFTQASQIITDIINKVATNAPRRGDSTNLNMTFNIQSIIPKKPFFYYTQENSDTIVFGEFDAIPLTSDVINKLKKIIKPYSITIPSTELFYNSNGPIAGVQIGDGVYISCQPAGSSKEKIAVEYDKKSSSKKFNLYSILNNQIFQMIMYILIGFIALAAVFYGVVFGYNYVKTGTLSTGDVKIPFISNLFTPNNSNSNSNSNNT
jgi:carbonic anhydrase